MQQSFSVYAQKQQSLPQSNNFKRVSTMFKSELNGQLKRLFLALEYVLQTKEKRYSMFMYVSSLFQQEQRGLPTCIVLQMVRFQLNYKVELYF